MRHAFTTLAVVLAGVLLAAQMAMAQDKDPRITELIEKMKADMEAGKTAEIEMTMTFELVGLPTPPQLQQPMVMQMWRDHDNTRVEMAQGNVVVVIKDNEMTMYQGMVGFALVHRARRDGTAQGSAGAGAQGVGPSAGPRRDDHHDAREGVRDDHG